MCTHILLSLSLFLSLPLSRSMCTHTHTHIYTRTPALPSAQTLITLLQISTTCTLTRSHSLSHILCRWAAERSVTLRFRAEERCKFDREEKRKVESATEHVSQVPHTHIHTHRTLTHPHS